MSPLRLLRRPRPLEADERGGEEPEGHEPSGPSSRRRAGRLLLALVVLAVAVAGGWFLRPGGSGAGSSNAGTGSPSYDEVVQTDLSQVQSLDGTLGYTSDATIVNRLAGASVSTTSTSSGAKATLVSYLQTDASTSAANLPAAKSAPSPSPSPSLSPSPSPSPSPAPSPTPQPTLAPTSPSGSNASTTPASTGGSSAGSQSSNSDAGTVTWMAAEGVVVGRGARLYAVDEQPVTLLFGSVPAWRAIKRGIGDGRDVLELERNLKALGFDDGGSMVVDHHFDSATKQAVIDWQRSIGADDDGVVDLGEVVFLLHAVRIDQQLVALGSSAASGAEILEVGPTSPEVSVSLTSDQLDLVSVGSQVQIQLPDGSSTLGTVAAIGSPASSSSGQANDSDTTVSVAIALDRPKAAKGLTGASVTVDVVTDQRTDALAIPVTALLAQQSGGYAVQVDVGGGKTRLVPVSPGLFDDAQGLVEITSGGLQPGDRVVVASS